jgi:sugar lactone lactonase YvrE
MSLFRAMLAVLALLLSFHAAAWDRGKVERFATLPAGAANPEGITVDRHGDVFVTTFAVTGTPPGRLFVFDDDGHLKREVQVAGSSNLLLGVAFHPLTHDLLVVDFGSGRVLRVNPFSGAATVFATVTGASGLNALAFDRAGNVYISDSAQGIVWRTGPAGGAALAWVSHPLLTTTGFPPFGANGMDFNRREDALFVANTGNDQVIRIPVTAGAPGVPAVFVNAINGADGLFLDEHDNLWVCANQADEIVVLDRTGRVIAKLGDFDGLKHGAPEGLLFPASLVRKGDWIYVTNLSLDLRLFGLPQAVDSQWAADVTRHTISRLRARLPK